MFLFVDQILKLDPGKSAVGVHHVRQDSPFLEPGPSGDAMLSCVVGEALGQLGAWSVMAANDFALRPVAGIVGGVHIHGQAQVGETLTLDTTIDSVSDEAVHYHAVATVGDRKILTLEDAVGPFLAMAEFSDVDVVRRQFESIHRPGAADGVRWADRETGGDPALPSTFDFDAIDVTAPGEASTARKAVTADQRFFVDHFQRKPVVPLSLLLQALLQQAGALLTEPGARPPSATRLSSVKMRRFLEPGDALTATVRVRDRSEAAVHVQFRCYINDKRACTANAEFSTAPVGETA